MLYAELHGKLDDTALDLERREDILTSTVFGTLLVAGATKVLVKWFNSARCLAGTPEHLDLKRLLGLPYEYLNTGSGSLLASHSPTSCCELARTSSL